MDWGAGIKNNDSFLRMQVLFREDATADDLIDVIQGNRVYLPCVYAYNKIDQVPHFKHYAMMDE